MSIRSYTILYPYVGLEDGRHEKLILWFTNNTHIPGKQTLPTSMYIEVYIFLAYITQDREFKKNDK